MTISIIAAIGRNREIGRRGDLAFHISADLRRFKALTMGSPIIMGRKTFESFPNGALPGRRNIVVTRNASYTAHGIETAPSLESAIAMAEGASTVYIIGGGEIYRQALPMATRLDLTLVDAELPDADTFFPHYSDTFTIAEVTDPETCPKTGLSYRFATLTR